MANRRISNGHTLLKYRRIFLVIFSLFVLYNIIFFISPRAKQWKNDLIKTNSSRDFFLIEPVILFKTDPGTYTNWFPSKQLSFDRDLNVLTLGTFNDQVTLNYFKNIKFVESIYGKSPFISRNLELHHFIQANNQIFHIVIFHKFENFFWVGAIPENIQEILSQNYNITLKNFGLYEQVFDQFDLSSIIPESDGFRVPNEIGHFLGQISTSRYIHCTDSSREWSQKNNISYDSSKAVHLHKSLSSMKSLMKQLHFEFWIFCGTLLGWYRQCSVIPYTTDSDYATWSSSLDGKDITDMLLEEATKHKLKLFYRFGEPTMTQEFSFMDINRAFKSDLFFIYPNSSYFRLPWHVAKNKEWTYSFYPKFQLCSAVLLSEKILVPCTPGEVLSTEYGKNWNAPVTEDKFDWIKSPPNVDSFYKFNFSIPQYSEF